MGTVELLVIAVSLSMDAFAVAICKGLSVQKLKVRHALIAGAYFGGFQAAMPLLGWLLGVRFQELIASVDHWIAFVLLCAIGANMIKESRSKEEEKMNDLFTFRVMFPLAVATSIDALTVGIAFAFLKVNIIAAVTTIGVTTFLFSCFGTKIGNMFGTRYKSKAELCGGIVLICLGTKILLEHLGVLPF